MTQVVMDLLEKEHILLTCVPNNMTYISQPLDFSVNSWGKRYMKEKFAMWYTKKMEGLDNGINIGDVDVKTSLQL